jgi:ribosomal protein S1
MSDASSSKGNAHSGNAKSMAELMSRQASTFQSLKRGDTVKGVVKKLTPKEILLDIGYKSDALVIEYDKQNMENLLGLLKVGDTVTASVISPESEEGFPVLSLRRMLEEKVYGALEGVFKADTTLTAYVLEVTRGGYFIETKEGIKGFLPNSQLLDARLMQGDKVEVKVIEFDREKKRVIVSQKATHYLMNISEIEKEVKRDTVVKALITLVTPYGIYLEVSPREGVLIEGFIHISEVSHQRVEGLEGKFKIGETLDAQIIGVDVENKRVNLSLKRLEKDNFEDVKKKYKVEEIISAVVTDVKTKGITLQVEAGVMAFIPSNKVPTDTTYKKDDKVEVEVTDFDDKKRLILVSPVLKTKVLTYR